MSNLIKAFGNFYLYSSVHIALCAGLLTFESYLLLHLPVDLNVVLFITFATMSIYSLHRLVGMSKVQAFDNQGRYKIIKKYKHHILVYFIISSLAVIFFFFQLPYDKILLVVIPGLITLAYVLPILKSKKRLRDLPFIKIFIIALVWTWLSLFLPATLEHKTLLTLLALERILFFIAITIPFDIRDIEVDESIGVQTLVHHLGIKKSKLLAQALLLIGLAVILYLFTQSLINQAALFGLSLSYFICFILIQFSNEKKQDWYFGGLLDGTIGLRLILILIFLQILG